MRELTIIKKKVSINKLKVLEKPLWFLVTKEY